jgi:hypothetical protein
VGFSSDFDGIPHYGVKTPPDDLKMTLNAIQWKSTPARSNYKLKIQENV